MKRKIDIIKQRKKLNIWVADSLELFEATPYLDNILTVYPFSLSRDKELDDDFKRKLNNAHIHHDKEQLVALLKESSKFPYEDPVWYLLKTVKGCLKRNPAQIDRITENLFRMTAEEAIIRLESPPKLNTQAGPMFRNWLLKNYSALDQEQFLKSKKGLYLLDASEEDGKQFVAKNLNQKIHKRPDIICKANEIYVIGEAKWIGCSGGNQEKQVKEVLDFCKEQRGEVRRVGIVDGYPWAVFRSNGEILNDRILVSIQESSYDILSALLFDKYLISIIGKKHV